MEQIKITKLLGCYYLLIFNAFKNSYVCYNLSSMEMGNSKLPLHIADRHTSVINLDDILSKFIREMEKEK